MESMRPTRKRYFSRLIVALTVYAASCAHLLAADIRADYQETPIVTRSGMKLGPRSVIVEGKIEAGDYDKLRSIYGERYQSEFSFGLIGVNVLSLASPGGDLAEAMKIGRLVRALKLITAAPSRNPFLSHLDMGSVGEGLHTLKNPQANYMCASACFFIFVAGIKRTAADGSDEAILGIHKPYLSDSDLRMLGGDQAIASANRLRTTVENYLKEMGVPAKYADMMFAVPKDEVRWIGSADFKNNLEGIIPELKDWIAARCDTRTDVEKALWKKMMAEPRPIGQLSAADRSLFDLLDKKMQAIYGCEEDNVDTLSAEAWLQMFDPKCEIIRQDIEDWSSLAPPQAKAFCDRQK
jgi:hypothetical protein